MRPSLPLRLAGLPDVQYDMTSPIPGCAEISLTRFVAAFVVSVLSILPLPVAPITASGWLE